MPFDHLIEAEWMYAQPGAKAPSKNVKISIGDGVIGDIVSGSSGRGKVALPALTNAHDHGRCFRPVAYGIDDQPLECWLAMLHHTPAIDMYTQSVVAFGRMALSGIANISQVHIPMSRDPVGEAREVARAAADVGIRVAYAAPIADTNAFVYGGKSQIADCYSQQEWSKISRWDNRDFDAADQIAVVDAIDKACGSDKFIVQYGPAGPQWLTEKGWELLAERRAATGRRMHTHILESKTQRQWSDYHYSGGMLNWMDQLGLVNSSLTIAHFVWPTDAEIALAAERGACVSVNSSSNFRLQSGIAPVTRFKNAGLRFACGLDGMAFNDDEDGIFELRLLSKLHAQRGLDGPGISVGEAWKAATTTGRFTIDGKPDGGILETGADADIMIVDLDAMAPDGVRELFDPMDMIMTRARGLHVCDLFVGGRQVVRDSKLTGVDLESAERYLAEAGRREAADLAGEMPMVRRHRDNVREYYVSSRHLEQRDG